MFKYVQKRELCKTVKVKKLAQSSYTPGAAISFPIIFQLMEMAAQI
jgi:hypothetical protein